MPGTYFNFQPTTASYVHNQTIAANVWIVTHQLNSTTLSVETWVEGKLVFANITSIDANSIAIEFNIPATGSAYIAAAIVE